MWLILPIVIAFLPHTYRTRTLFRKGAYGRSLVSQGLVCVIVKYTEKFYELAKEILALDGIVHYDMIYLDCDDLKHELSTQATSLGQSVHEKLAVTHRTENTR